MGANLLGLVLANTSNEQLFDASICLQAPMRLDEVFKNVVNTLGGFYNIVLGNNFKC